MVILNQTQIEALCKQHKLNKKGEVLTACAHDPSYSKTGWAYKQAVLDHLCDENGNLPLTIAYFESIFPELIKRTTPASLQSYLNALQMMLKYYSATDVQGLRDWIGEQQTANHGRLKVLRNNNTFSRKNSENHIPWEDIGNGVKQFTDEHLKKGKTVSLHLGQISNLIIVRLLRFDNYEAPRRNELLKLQFLNEENKTKANVNLVDLKNKKVILRDYKTFAVYGEYEFPLTKETLALMKILKRTTSTNTSPPYLFPNWANRTAQSAIVQAAFKQVLRTDKKLNVNLLRELFYQPRTFKSWEDQELWSKRLGHSVEQSLSTYHRHNHPESESGAEIGLGNE